MKNDWMTIAEAAVVFGIPINTMREIFRADGVPVLRLQKKLRVKTGDVKKTFAAHYKPLLEVDV